MAPPSPPAAHEGLGLLKQHHLAKLENVVDQHPAPLAIHVAWGIYHPTLPTSPPHPPTAPYRHKDPTRGKKIFEDLTRHLANGIPKDLPELISLDRTIKHHAKNILALFDHPSTPNSPSEAINSHLEHPHGPAPGSQQPDLSRVRLSGRGCWLLMQRPS